MDFQMVENWFDALIVQFDTMYTIPICIWSYKESANSLNAYICISSCEALTRSNPKLFHTLIGFHIHVCLSWQ